MKKNLIFTNLEALTERLSNFAEIKEETVIYHHHLKIPIRSLHFGSKAPDAPCLVIVAGVHGLEVIGTQLAISFLEMLESFLSWDHIMRDELKHMKLIVYPCANPGGLLAGTRANPQGVDLMRNAPIDAEGIQPWSLISGHRISNRIPWYRGRKNSPMEPEAQTLCDFIKRETFHHPFTIALDLHSGFGMKDRLWFPYAFSSRPFPDAGVALTLKNLLDSTFPYHIYSVEPQCLQYKTNGDIWDYLYLEHRKQAEACSTFLPICLELGSWAWIKKNPRQLFSLLGIFNPMITHRLHRTMRRHTALLDFLMRATISYKNWARLDAKETQKRQQQAELLWYDQKA